MRRANASASVPAEGIHKRSIRGGSGINDSGAI